MGRGAGTLVHIPQLGRGDPEDRVGGGSARLGGEPLSAQGWTGGQESWSRSAQEAGV